MKMQDRVILHCDANNFFASVETISKPELLGKPVAVSGNPKKRTGIILAKNECAKKFGVKTGEPIWEALQKCPNLVLLPPHHDLYEVYSQNLKEIYLSYTDRVESFGIDECWLDVTGSQKLFGSGFEIAETIRKRVKEELKITVSIGVSFCKLFAKIGSDLKKPDAITVISKQNFKDIIYPLPINATLGIGRKSEQALTKLGVFTIGEYVLLPDSTLEAKFGKPGIELKNKLLGFDNDPVKLEQPPPKSIGNGTTTVVDIITREEINSTIDFLTEKIAERLRERNFLAYGVGVSLKTNEFKTQHKEKKFFEPTSSSIVLAQRAMEIVDSFWDYKQLVRSVRVRTFALVSEDSFIQTSLFTDKKKQGIGYGLDLIRSKYGDKSITLASTLKKNYLPLD